MYRVGEFEFATEEQARAARREEEGIKYIISKTNMKDPNTVHKLYGRLIQKEVFETPVGYAFLKGMRMYLEESPFIDDEEIEPLPEFHAPAAEEQSAPKEVKKERAKKAKSVQKPALNRQMDYRKGFMVSTFLAVAFAAALIGMFVITALSTDNVNIINYENALIDKYELWEQELNEREADLREREAALLNE